MNAGVHLGYRHGRFVPAVPASMLTAKAMATELGLTLGTAYRRIPETAIARVSGRVRVDQVEFEEWLENHRTTLTMRVRAKVNEGVHVLRQGNLQEVG